MECGEGGGGGNQWKKEGLALLIDFIDYPWAWPPRALGQACIFPWLWFVLRLISYLLETSNVSWGWLWTGSLVDSGGVSGLAWGMSFGRGNNQAEW